MFGVKHFHQYLYGRDEPFVVRTDHQPLVAIFGKKNGVFVMAASRLQRYAIYLSAYYYKITYVTSENNIVADYFFRAPLGIDKGYSDDDENVTYLNFMHETDLPVSFKNI